MNTAFPLPAPARRALPAPTRWRSVPWSPRLVPAADGVLVQVDVFAVGNHASPGPEGFGPASPASFSQAAAVAVRALLQAELGIPAVPSGLVVVWGTVPDPEGQDARLTGACLFGVDAEELVPRLVAVVSALGHASPPLTMTGLLAPSSNHGRVRSLSTQPMQLKPILAELEAAAARWANGAES